MLPGVIGTLQATEALKLIIGNGEPLRGALVVYDALSTEFRKFTIPRDPGCAVCGDVPTVTAPIDYERFCQPEQVPSGIEVREIDPVELQKRLARPDDFLLLDVREPVEAEIAAIEGARLIPLAELERRLPELEGWRERPIVVHCHHGGRSRKACELLLSKGFRKVENLNSGIEGWSLEVDPEVPRY